MAADSWAAARLLNPQLANDSNTNPWDSFSTALASNSNPECYTVFTSYHGNNKTETFIIKMIITEVNMSKSCLLVH